MIFKTHQMKNSIIIFLLLHIVTLSSAQMLGLGYEIAGAYNRPITKEKLSKVQVITDINERYPTSWIKEYVSVEISATNNGKAVKIASKDDQLSDEQLSILKLADIGTNVTVDINYFPDNTLSENPARNINFSVTVIPAVEAEYPDGYKALKQYLKANAIDKVYKKMVDDFRLVKIKFTVNEEGGIINTQITKPSGDQEIDILLIQTINNMKKWKPAENAKGENIQQEFEFSVGELVGC